MADLDERLRTLDRLRPPDLWPDIERRGSGAGPPLRSRGRGVVAIAALALAAAAIGLLAWVFLTRRGPATPANPGTVGNGELWAVGTCGEPGCFIYSIDPDGSAKDLLWTDGRDPNSPPDKVHPELVGIDYAWSPDGSRVAFSHDVRDEGTTPPGCCYELFEMNADGSGLVQLTHDGGFAGFPSWSPDGTRVLYTSYRGDAFDVGCLGSILCPADLYMINADGSGETRLTSDPADESMGTWSPDGTKIVFGSAHGGPGFPGDLSIMDADGSNVVRLPTPGGTDPKWSPQGTTIAFLCSPNRDTFRICAVNPDGSGFHELTDTGWDTTDYAFAWSPDGAQIAFGRLASPTGAQEIDLYVMNANGSSQRKIAGGLEPVAWRPVPQG